MEKFKDLQELVKKKGFGSTEYNHINGDPVYLSRGIREVFLGDKKTENLLMGAVSRFQKQDYGNAAEYGKNPRKGHEYGRYEISPLTADVDEDNGVWLHRAEDSIMVYFAFERGK